MFGQLQYTDLVAVHFVGTARKAQLARVGIGGRQRTPVARSVQ
jgi:hypothetical protein